MIIMTIVMIMITIMIIIMVVVVVVMMMMLITPDLAVTSMSQRLSSPEFQPTTTESLYPLHKHLLIKRSQRCKECEHNLSKSEFNPSSIKFKIQLVAL